MNNLFVSLCSKKVYWSVTTELWWQLSPFPVISILHGTFLSHHSVGQMHNTAISYTTIQHHPATAPLMSVHKVLVTKRSCSVIFFLLFFLPPSTPPPHTSHPRQPWHKMVKWCSTAEFNFTVQLGPWLHCQIQINVHLTNMDQGNSGWQPAVIGAIDSGEEFYALSTAVHHCWNWLIKWIHCYNYL